MEFAVLDPRTDRELARIHLNGHVIQPGGPMGQAGAMRSFTLLTGSLRDQWAHQRPLILRKGDGREIAVRIAALPVDDGEAGFVEIL